MDMGQTEQNESRIYSNCFKRKSSFIVYRKNPQESFSTILLTLLMKIPSQLNPFPKEAHWGMHAQGNDKGDKVREISNVRTLLVLERQTD